MVCTEAKSPESSIVSAHGRLFYVKESLGKNVGPIGKQAGGSQ